MTRSTLFLLLALGTLSGCAGYGRHGSMHDNMHKDGGQMMGGGMMGTQGGTMMGQGGMMGDQGGSMMGQGGTMGAQGGAMMGPAMFHQGVLAAMGGRTLYRFDKDTAGSGSSACNGDCAAKWPPYLASPGAQPRGDFAILSRADGSKQWSYKGWPLYFWQGDKQAGDMMGDNIGGVWHVVRP